MLKKLNQEELINLLEEINAEAKIGSWELNIRTNEFYMANEVYKIFEIEEIDPGNIYSEYLNRIHPDDYEFVQSITKNVFKNGNIFEFEHKIICPTNLVKCIRMRLIIKRNENGDMVNIRAIVMDITESKMLEKSSQLSRLELKSILDSSFENILLLNANMEIVSFNKTAKETVKNKIGKDIAVGHSMLEYTVVDDFKDNFYRALHGEKVNSIREAKINTGSYWIETDYFPVKDEKGTTIGVCYNTRDITEKKKLEKERNKLNELLTDTSDNLPGVLYQFKLEKNGKVSFPFSSKKGKEIFLIERGKLKEDGSPAFSIVHKDDLQKLHESIAESAKNLSPWECEYRVIINNLTKWVKGHSIPKMQDDGSILWSGYIYDTTNEREQRDEMERLALISKNTSNLVILTDLERRIIWVNNAFTKLTGYTLEEVAGKKPSFLQFEGTSKETVEFIRKELNSRKPVRFEILNKGKRGNNYWLDVNIQPMIVDGKIVGFSAIESDITELKTLNEELIRKKSVLNNINKLAIIGNWEYDLASDIIIWDEIQKNIYGVMNDYQPVLNDVITFYKEGGFREKLSVAIDKLFSVGESYDLELVLVTPSGQEKWVRTIATVEYFKGKPIKAYGITIDIDQSKRAEISRLEIEKERRLTKMRLDFFSNVSHEIRNPLNSILGYAELLKGKTISAKYEGYINSMINSSKIVASLLNDALDTSKIEADMFELYPGQINLEEAIYNTKKMFLPAIKKSKSKIEIKIQNHLPEILLVDDVRLKQVLFNLIGNAVKFTESGLIKIGVDFEINTDKSALNYLNIEVIDNGIGIEKKNLKKIFNPFTQFQNSETKIGSGLGLYISRKIVRLMGGELKVESEIGKGSIFKIELKNIAIGKSKDELIKANLFGEYLFDGETILLVDDIASNREIFKAYLEDYKLTIQEAECGESALELMKSNIPDIVLLDIMMPGKNGFQVAKEIREKEQFNNVKIIGISALPLKEEEQYFFNDYMRKPVKKEELIRLISAQLYAPNNQNESDNLSSLEPKKITRSVVKENLNPKSKSIYKEGYSLQSIYEILKNDEIKIETCISDFLNLVSSARKTIETVLVNKNYEDLRDKFHNLLNICSYFNANLLLELIIKYREEKSIKKRVVLLNEIKKELGQIEFFLKTNKIDN